MTVLSNGDGGVNSLGDSNILNALRVEARDHLASYGVIVKFPDLTIAISNKPMIAASDHAHNVCGLVVGWVHHKLLLNWVDSNFEEITSLSIVNIYEFPPFDIAIATSCDKKLFFLVENNDFYETIMKRGLQLLVTHQMRLHEVTVPKDERTVLSTAEHLTVWELAHTSHV